VIRFLMSSFLGIGCRLSVVGCRTLNRLFILFIRVSFLFLFWACRQLATRFLMMLLLPSRFPLQSFEKRDFPTLHSGKKAISLRCTSGKKRFPCVALRAILFTKGFPLQSLTRSPPIQSYSEAVLSLAAQRSFNVVVFFLIRDIRPKPLQSRLRRNPTAFRIIHDLVFLDFTHPEILALRM